MRPTTRHENGGWVSGRCSVCGLSQHSDVFGPVHFYSTGIVLALCQRCNEDLTRTGWDALDFDGHQPMLLVQHPEGPTVYRVGSGVTETLLLSRITEPEAASQVLGSITGGREIVFNYVERIPEED